MERNFKEVEEEEEEDHYSSSGYSSSVGYHRTGYQRGPKAGEADYQYRCRVWECNSAHTLSVLEPPARERSAEEKIDDIIISRMMQTFVDNSNGLVTIENRFRLTTPLRLASQTYLGEDLRDKKTVFIKLQLLRYQQMIREEVKRYAELEEHRTDIDELERNKNITFSQVIATGTLTSFKETKTNYAYLVLKDVGRSLEYLHEQKKDLRGNKIALPISEICKIASQGVELLKFFHETMKWIHRDVHPGNFVMDDNGALSLVDFRNVVSIDYRHDFLRSDDPTSTRSYNNAKHQKKLRKYTPFDDLESLAFMLIELAKPTLPWREVPVKKMSYLEKLQNVISRRIIKDVKKQCKGLPEIFGRFLDFMKNHAVNDGPYYEYWAEKFRMEAADQKKLEEKMHFLEIE